MGGGRRPPTGGIRNPPPVLPTLSLGRLMKWNNYQNCQGDCLMRVSQGTVFGKPESGAQKYSKCQTPPYEKNKLLLNEYLGDFMHFETLFFFFLVGGVWTLCYMAMAGWLFWSVAAAAAGAWSWSRWFSEPGGA